MVHAGVAAIHTFTNALVYICNIFSPTKVEEKSLEVFIIIVIPCGP